MSETRVKMLELKLEPGIGSEAGPNPVIEYVGGPHPYLWIGDDDRCYGTLDPDKTRKLIEFAKLSDTKEAG